MWTKLSSMVNPPLSSLSLPVYSIGKNTQVFSIQPNSITATIKLKRYCCHSYFLSWGETYSLQTCPAQGTKLSVSTKQSTNLEFNFRQLAKGLAWMLVNKKTDNSMFIFSWKHFIFHNRLSKQSKDLNQNGCPKAILQYRLQGNTRCHIHKATLVLDFTPLPVIKQGKTSIL